MSQPYTCPRCHNMTFLEYDHHTTYHHCLHCGIYEDIDITDTPSLWRALEAATPTAGPLSLPIDLHFRTGGRVPHAKGR